MPTVMQTLQKAAPVSRRVDPTISLRSLLALPTGQRPALALWLGEDRYAMTAPDLLRPLVVRVRKESDTSNYVALSEATGIFGAGSSVASAVEDFAAALRDHMEVLLAESAEGELPAALADQLRFLQRHLQP